MLGRPRAGDATARDLRVPRCRVRATVTRPEASVGRSAPNHRRDRDDPPIAPAVRRLAGVSAVPDSRASCTAAGLAHWWCRGPGSLDVHRPVATGDQSAFAVALRPAGADACSASSGGSCVTRPRPRRSPRRSSSRSGSRRPASTPSGAVCRTWAVTIAHRRAVDRVRSEQAHRDRQLRSAAVDVDDDPTPEDTAARHRGPAPGRGRRWPQLSGAAAPGARAGVLRRADPRADRRPARESRSAP